MCSAPDVPPAPPPPPPPPPAPEPYVAQIAQDPIQAQMRNMASRLGTNQLVIPLRPVNQV